MEGKKKIKRITLVDQIVSELRKEIVTGVYQPGSNLPTEKELIEQFSASRLSIRNAIMILARDGLIETIHGRRGIIKDYKINARIDFLPDIWLCNPEKITPDALYMLRRHGHWLYGRIIITACPKALPSDETRLNEILNKITEDMSAYEWYTVDLNFFHELLRIGDNITLMMFHNSYSTMMRKLMESELIMELDHINVFYSKYAPNIVKHICSNNLDELRPLLRLVESEIMKIGIKFYKKVGIEI